MIDNENMGGLQTMGILNALKTGNVQIDLLIAMCIPLFIRFLFSNIESLRDNFFHKEFWVQWWVRTRGYHERFLVSKSVVDTDRWSSNHTSLDNDTQNSVLIKAIKLYVHAVCKVKMDAANLDLTSTSAKEQRDGYWSDPEDDGDGPKTLVGTLEQYKLIKRPMYGRWHDIGLFGTTKPLYKVELFISELADTIGSKEAEKERTTLKYHLRSRGSTSIDDFVEKAYNWYLDELRKLEDNSRHYYELGKVESEEEGSSTRYKRYKLSDEKTFESLFFKQKDMVVKIVDHFQEKSGKYAIKGYPHKLGLLLHGPPGTGKTSLIKALANHTGRSIVNVPLAKITTNAELQSVFFDNRYLVDGEDVAIKLGFKDVIFVLEDVDSASNVVKRRDGKKTADVMQIENVDLPPSKTIWRLLLESSDDDCQELVKELMEKSERLKKEATKPEVLKGLASGMSQLPGLSLVGSSDSTLAKIGEEAAQSANATMEGKEIIDRFLSMHVKPLKALLTQGGEVTDVLVNELLNTPGSSNALAREASREVAYEFADGDQAIPEIVLQGGSDQPAIGQTMGPFNVTDAVTTDKGDDKPKKAASYAFKDRLNLSGLLNVLDGVVDTPGRMLIMTTNHPEQLDPALIRPGRIDKKILLGFMASSDIIKMLEHYFLTELTNAQRLRIDGAIHGNPELNRPQLKLTPAQVEQLAAEHDELEDMIQALEEKGHPRIPLRQQAVDRRTSSSSKIAFGV